MTQGSLPPDCLIMDEPRFVERRSFTRNRASARVQQTIFDGELSSAAKASEVSAFMNTVLARMASLAGMELGGESCWGGRVDIQFNPELSVRNENVSNC